MESRLSNTAGINHWTKEDRYEAPCGRNGRNGNIRMAVDIYRLLSTLWTQACPMIADKGVGFLRPA